MGALKEVGAAEGRSDQPTSPSTGAGRRNTWGGYASKDPAPKGLGIKQVVDRAATLWSGLFPPFMSYQKPVVASGQR